MSSPKFRVAICGGGIGGLSLALGLSRHDNIQIDVYEAAAQFKEIGAGIGIWGQGLTTLSRWGLEAKARAIATVGPGQYDPIRFELRRSDQHSEGDIMGYIDMSTNFGFQRSQLIDLLAHELTSTGRVNTHFGKRCVSFTQHPYEHVVQNGVTAESSYCTTLQFMDGTSATCDVLIGCDGIKSTIRGELLYGPTKSEHNKLGSNRFIGTQFSETVAYRCLVKTEDVKAIDPGHGAITGRKFYCGKNRHMVSYPVAGGRFLNFIGFSSDPERQKEWCEGEWVSEVSHEELNAYFWDFEPEVQTLLKCVDKVSRWAMYDLQPLGFWSKGNVTLMGDAAHGMTPFIGSGGGQVLEDAYVLSNLLGSPLSNRRTLASVLLAYERVRINRANRVIRASRAAGCALEFRREYENKSNREVAKALTELTEWLWENKSDLNADVQEGERVLMALIEERDSHCVTPCYGD